MDQVLSVFKSWKKFNILLSRGESEEFGSEFFSMHLVKPHCSKPIVGITKPLDYFDREPLWGNAGGYRAVVEIVTAVETSGGTAQLLFPGFDEPKIDALILPGGGDLDPSLYGQTPHSSLGDLDPKFDEYQLRWARSCFDSKLPMLGICRGMQVMNVAAGGTLIQHVEGADRHFPDFARDDASLRPTPVHSLTLERGSELAKIVKDDTVKVNSLHHQAVDKVASLFEVSARADDGLVEGIERRDAWQVGVQFHPEDLRHADRRFSRLFETLIERARV